MSFTAPDMLTSPPPGPRPANPEFSGLVSPTPTTFKGGKVFQDTYARMYFYARIYCDCTRSVVAPKTCSGLLCKYMAVT